MIYLEKYAESDPKKRRQTEHELGRKLLKKGLWEEYHIHDEVKQQGHKKPYLKNYPEIYFSISHTNGLVACGISNAMIGVDVEQIREVKEKLFDKVCTEEEKAYILEKDSTERFFRVWTLKEAHLKATGQGLTVPMKDIHFRFGENGEITGNIAGWKYRQFLYGDEYIVSVCEEEKIS